MSNYTTIKPWQIIKDLELHNLRTNKEQIIDANRDNNEFLEGCRLALDPMITFGIKQVPEKLDSDGDGLSHDAFTLALTGFVNRSFTGNLAREVVETMMRSATQDQWNNWYRRILIKDLRCGVSEKTINKVVPGTIPVFGCMLAHDGANHEKKIAGDCFIEFKYDGVRVIAIVQNGTATLYSRNGKILSNFPHIEEALSKTEFNGLVFDGEVMSADFQTLMKQVHRKEDAQTQDAYLVLFDFLPLEDFNQGVCNRDAATRRHWLESIFTLFKSDCVRLVDVVRANLDTLEGQEEFRVANKVALELGYEGLMIKPAHAIYECKRSAAWLKLKPFIEVSLTVVGVEEGTGRNKGRLGALVCSGTDDNRHIKVNVGSGFSDSDRDTFWAGHVEFDNLIEQVVEIRADAVTQNQDGSYSLRFPRFLRFRGFAPGEKL